MKYSDMKTLSNKNLKPYNTLSLSEDAELILQADSVSDLVDIWSNDEYKSVYKLPLGRGSNTLFLGKFNGIVVLNRLLGKAIEETNSHYIVTVSSGEDWPNLVKWCVDKGIYGLENLAMIPGCVGSAPIQNIGAYGLEFKDICQSVEYLDLSSLNVLSVDASECAFGYRDSVFKQALKDKVVITAITLKLTKKWKPLLSYGPLRHFDSEKVTALDIYQEVCSIRSQKLPDPTLLGNAGSFFKNPVITIEDADKLKNKFPEVPLYKIDNGYKVAAGWLIDHAGLKGVCVNGAQVHNEQALVLVNLGNATSEDIVTLANHVKQTVLDVYEIELEHEVRFYSQGKETYLAELFNERAC